MNVLSLARDGVRRLAPYKAAIQVADTVRLNANEAPWRNAGDNFRRPLNRYPEIRPARLRELLGRFYGVDAGNLLVTRGSSEAIDLLMRVFCEAGRDNVVTTSPTFSMYEHYAIVQGAELRQVATDPAQDFRVDVDRVLAACDAETKLIILCSPNNPTGTLVPAEAIHEVLEGRGDRSVIVVDEAYIEFSGAASATDLLGRFDNLVVLRTLSKALAFAGARCGAVVAARGVIDMLDAVQAPYAIATPVIECVEDALDAEGLARAEARVAETIGERERVRAALSEIGRVRRTWPSAANFLLAEVADASGLVAHCGANQVLIRHFGGELEDCVRITIGSRAENDRLLGVLAALEANGD
jgi:histidinol-phosphate aminotransferase